MNFSVISVVILGPSACNGFSDQFELGHFSAVARPWSKLDDPGVTAAALPVSWRNILEKMFHNPLGDHLAAPLDDFLAMFAALTLGKVPKHLHPATEVVFFGEGDQTLSEGA